MFGLNEILIKFGLNEIELQKFIKFTFTVTKSFYNNTLKLGLVIVSDFKLFPIFESKART
jgi:hypothetical protein